MKQDHLLKTNYNLYQVISSVFISDIWYTIGFSSVVVSSHTLYNYNSAFSNFCYVFFLPNDDQYFNSVDDHIGNMFHKFRQLGVPGNRSSMAA